MKYFKVMFLLFSFAVLKIYPKNFSPNKCSKGCSQGYIIDADNYEDCKKQAACSGRDISFACDSYR